MSQKSQAFDYKDHWQEKEIILERPDIGGVTSLGFTIAGGSDKPVVQNFTYILVVRIIANGLADRDKRLKLYDIILRVNDVDYTNIRHETGVQMLRTAGKQVRLVIHRLIPAFTEMIELKHQNGKLGISIAGGIGSEHFKGDPGVFITDISNKMNRQQNIGDRLLEISSAKNTYDLRFVTHNEAKKRIGLACSDSQKVRLTVGIHKRKLIKPSEKSNVLRPEHYNLQSIKDEVFAEDKRMILRQSQYDSHSYTNEGNTSVQINQTNNSIMTTKNHHFANFESTRTLLPSRENATRHTLIESFDFEDYQRYENRSKLRVIDYRSKNTILARTLPSKDLQIHLEVARKTNVLQYDLKNLKEIPPEICSLSSLRTLSLNDNEIRLLPDDFKNLVNLKNFYFRNNQIESLASVLFTHYLSKLENLQLNGNRLHSLPASFSYLTALRQLNLSNNRFFTIPRAILTLTNLQVVDLSANRITQVKDEIELLEVDELNLNNNQISHISANISKCKRLKILRLDNNKLNLKSIPTSLLKDSTVSQLTVKGNCFEEKQFQLIEGFDDYERRYTANQRKKD